jgi:hypothetical protein
MKRRHSSLLCVMALMLGCGPSPQQQYDTAVKAFDRAQARLDALRPAYDAARQKAVLAVCKEITGTTPEESALGALSQFEAAQTEVIAGLTSGTQPAAEGAAVGDPATAPQRATNPDAVIDQLIGAQAAMAGQQSALLGSVAKVQETMAKINTPGTPEAARVDELLSKMPEAQAYLRQEKRLARAQEAVDAADAALSEAAP